MSNSLLFFGRLLGLFLISPLFAGKGIPKTIRLALALSGSLILFPSLAKDFSLPVQDPFLWFLAFIKEAAIGYLIGFLFSLLFEAAGFAGEIIGVLMGLSLTEILDPLSNLRNPLLARFFILLSFAFFLVLDLHHLVLRFLYDSFESLPASDTPFNNQALFGVLTAVSLFFQYAIEFALLPLLILLLLLALFALLSRFFSIFWVGFPLQLLVGLLSLAASLYFFRPTLEHTFFQLFQLVKKSIVNY